MCSVDSACASSQKQVLRRREGLGALNWPDSHGHDQPKCVSPGEDSWERDNRPQKARWGSGKPESPAPRFGLRSRARRLCAGVERKAGRRAQHGFGVLA
jgi:hypothetical protein